MKPKRPKDMNQLAASIVAIASGNGDSPAMIGHACINREEDLKLIG